MLCDILELINSSYSLQILTLVESKFVYTTITVYLLFFSVFDFSLFSAPPVDSLLPSGSVEVMQLVIVLYYCHSACLQVSYLNPYIKGHCVRGIWGS